VIRRRPRTRAEMESLHHRERVFSGEAEAGGFDEGKALAFGGELAKQFDGFRGAKTAESFDSFDANENVAEGFVFAGGDFHEEGNGGGLLADANLIDHHWRRREDGPRRESRRRRMRCFAPTESWTGEQVR